MHDRAANLAVESSPRDGQGLTEGEQGAATEERPASGHEVPIRGISWLWLQSLGVLTIALLALVPTVGDFGLTWDEPAYRYSQVMSAQWWEQLGKVRSSRDVHELLDPSTLLYFWPYARFGINFHPPLAGQLNLACYEVFGRWMKDIPARRMASVIEFVLTITIGFHFLARRYGGWVGLIAAGSLLLMPRLYGQSHLVDTDMPGLLLWSATAIVFWKGLHEPNAWRWRVAVGILLGLAFVEKMGAVVVLAPLLLWLVLGHLLRTLARPGGRAAWIDGISTTTAMLAPLALAFLQIQIMQRRLKPPWLTDFFLDRPSSDLPGVILALPLVIWVVRRLLGRLLPANKVWGVERPALETWTAILAFAPVIGWLGNPAWWRETFPRLAHYYTLSNQRQGALPAIQILYFGQVYDYSLPWHNAWVLMAITVPAAILGAAVIGLVWAIGRIPHDRLPFFFLVQFMTLPAIRMLDTPAHDGVRLFLPAFFFLAAFAGWGAAWLADAVAPLARVHAGFVRLACTAIVLGPAAYGLYRIHPYELSYYNELIGGPRNAWNHGFELTYWYDAFNGPVLEELNRRLPAHAEIDFLNPLTETSIMVFQVHQSLGELRGDVLLTARQDDRFPYVWLLTQDSKATAFTRLLFALRPWFASEPPQLDGARVASVVDPVAVSRAWALQTLLDAPDRSGNEPPSAPRWVRELAGWLARFWGDGLRKASRLTINQTILDWSSSDPEGLLAAARHIAAKQPLKANKDAERLMEILTTETNPDGPKMRHYATEQLLRVRPEALVEGVQILNAHRPEVVRVMSRYGYTDPPTIGGYLDRELPNPNIQGNG
jgi:4-amino-4-deoxy-L-arabinose transferase-like glycosyltransferase